MRTFLLVAALLAALLAPLSLAYAACAPPDRVPAHLSPCLEAAVDGPGPSAGLAWARNACADEGTVVVRWDLGDATPRMWHLSTGHTRAEALSARPASAPVCCADLGPCAPPARRAAPPGPYTRDAPGCARQWDRSAASLRCDLLSVRFGAGAHPWCHLRARCVGMHRPSASRLVPVERSVKLQDVDDLAWCPRRLPGIALVARSRC